MDQNLLNWVFAGFGAAAGFIMKVIWEGLRELQKADVVLTSKVADIQLVVAGQYVRKDDLDRVVSALFAKLDKIENKLDGKVDKAL